MMVREGGQQRRGWKGGEETPQNSQRPGFLKAHPNSSARKPWRCLCAALSTAAQAPRVVVPGPKIGERREKKKGGGEV